jgi:expansin (peptidoglycan-binding protein)
MHSITTSALAVVAFAASSVTAFNGRMTWFEPGLGACGWTNNRGDPVVALNPNQWAGGSRCGQWITINANGRQTAAQVADLCPGCPDQGIDVSPATFDDIANLDAGVVQVDWWFQ